MIRKIIQILTILMILFLLMMPALGLISDYQAVNAAKSYQNSDEIAVVFGPYTYEGHPYY